MLRLEATASFAVLLSHKIRILMESTQCGHDITIRDSKNALFRSYSTFVYLLCVHIPNINMRMYITIVLMDMN